jgi:hypothetical protein
MPWRRGVVVIVSTNGTVDRGFEPPQLNKREKIKNSSATTILKKLKYVGICHRCLHLTVSS